MTNSPQDPREQSAGVDSASQLDRKLLGDKTAERAAAVATKTMAPFDPFPTEVKARRSKAPLEVAQFAIMSYTGGPKFLTPSGHWSGVSQEAAIFNDFNVARLIAAGLPDLAVRVETRESFRMPMPV